MVYHNISGSLREGKAIRRVVKKEEKENMGKHNESKFPLENNLSNEMS